MKSRQSKRIVCLGGGIGTSNLLRGLKTYPHHLSVVTSMADDGGSSGRLRKAYGIMPPGDIISCIAALIPAAKQELADLLTYRLNGPQRENTSLGGHKLGNLLMLAEIQRTGDFYQAIDVVKRMFGVEADLFPATDVRVHLSALTKDGRRVHSETTLDLALYGRPHGLKKIFIRPKNPKVNPAVIDSLLRADCIISGPGDLYTNQLPVLVVPQIREAFLKSRAKKIFVLNIANKPFETAGFTLLDFIQAFTEHLGSFPFDTVIVNQNKSHLIPKELHYNYISVGLAHRDTAYRTVAADLVDTAFPIYHDPKKLASCIVKQL